MLLKIICKMIKLIRLWNINVRVWVESNNGQFRDWQLCHTKNMQGCGHKGPGLWNIDMFVVWAFLVSFGFIIWICFRVQIQNSSLHPDFFHIMVKFTHSFVCLFFKSYCILSFYANRSMFDWIISNLHIFPYTFIQFLILKICVKESNQLRSFPRDIHGYLFPLFSL